MSLSRVDVNISCYGLPIVQGCLPLNHLCKVLLQLFYWGPLQSIDSWFLCHIVLDRIRFEFSFSMMPLTMSLRYHFTFSIGIASFPVLDHLHQPVFLPSVPSLYFFNGLEHTVYANSVFSYLFRLLCDPFVPFLMQIRSPLLICTFLLALYYTCNDHILD